MKKYKVSIPLDYVSGYLRYGHLEGIIEAKDEEEAKKIAKETAIHDFEPIADGCELEDWGDPYYEDMEVTEIGEDD